MRPIPAGSRNRPGNRRQKKRHSPGHFQNGVFPAAEISFAKDIVNVSFPAHGNTHRNLVFTVCHPFGKDTGICRSAVPETKQRTGRNRCVGNGIPNTSGNRHFSENNQYVGQKEVKKSKAHNMRFKFRKILLRSKVLDDLSPEFFQSRYIISMSISNIRQRSLRESGSSEPDRKELR